MVLLMQLQLKTSLNICVILVLVLAVMQLALGQRLGKRGFFFMFVFFSIWLQKSERLKGGTCL